MTASYECSVQSNEGNSFSTIYIFEVVIFTLHHQITRPCYIMDEHRIDIPSQSVNRAKGNPMHLPYTEDPM